MALFLSCPSSSFCDLCWQFLSSERSASLFLRSDLLLPTNRLVVTGLGRERIGLAARRVTSVREGGGENTGEPVALTLCLSVYVYVCVVCGGENNPDTPEALTGDSLPRKVTIPLLQLLSKEITSRHQAIP